jgi:uncharacterized membrane protein YgdD (TMEM256/DUF423 family)
VNLLLLLGGLLGATGVALGAFGAHALRSRLSVERQATFETGVRYHLVHAGMLALTGLATSLLSGELVPAGDWLAAAGWLFAAGIVLFSGSLYLLVLTERRWLGAITPWAAWHGSPDGFA